ncbi:hypothetical protein [Microbacterium sp. NPDC057650]|uniref:hypothetical protein n=1 Tax=unclassified Microbacterium TaxID=2609290 RepID=UPI00366AF637
MDAAVGRESARWWRRAAWVIAGVLGLAAGLFGSVFGPYYIGAVGLALAVVGGVNGQKPGARMALAVGLGIIVGALLYVTLGFLMPGAPRSGSGSGVEG